MSAGQDLVELARRIDALERMNRRLLALAGVLLAGLVAVFAMGSNGRQPDVLEARGLVIRDSAGTARASLGIGSAGAELILNDTTGARRVLAASESEILHLGAMGQTGPAVLLTGPSQTAEVHQVALQSDITGSGLWVWEGPRGRSWTNPAVTLGVSMFEGEGLIPQLQIHSLSDYASAIYATVLPEGEVGLWPHGPSININSPRGDRLFKAPDRR